MPIRKEVYRLKASNSEVDEGTSRPPRTRRTCSPVSDATC